MPPAERGIERQRIVNLMIAEAMADHPKLNRDKLTKAFLDIVTMTWHAERIADLESRVEQMAQQLAALESQPAPARAVLKLRGNSDG